MQWLPTIMRVSLGGLAGIIIGWFSTNSANLQPSGTATLPLLLAFLTGYGIDVLFGLLDRLNGLIGQAAGSKST